MVDSKCVRLQNIELFAGVAFTVQNPEVLMSNSESGSPKGHQNLVVDRIEGPHAILITDAGKETSIERNRLHFELTEGLVIRVPIVGGALDWAQAKADRDETRSRLSQAALRMQGLRKSDPGGNMKL